MAKKDYLPKTTNWFRLPEIVKNLVSVFEKGDGVSGTFTTNDGKTIVVTNGVISSIV